MTLTLQIENYEILDDGGPARIEVPETGLSAGRSAGMGWVLPDASRHISGHHFDIFRDARGWWLKDVSTNGTFLQGQRYRLDGPHPLSQGDRFQVGQYIIVALLSAPAPVAGPRGGLTSDMLPDRSQGSNRYPPRHDEDPWSTGGGGFEPIDPLPARAGRPLDDFAQDFIPTAPVSSYGTDHAGGSPFGDPPPHQPSPFGRPDQGGTPAMDQPLPHSPSSPPQPEKRREITGIRPPTDSGPNPDFVVAFCNGAGLPPNLYGDVDSSALAHALGRAMRKVSHQIMLALQDRAAAKQFARTGERTMRSANDNNPLKFLPDADQAIEAMFLKPRAGFLAGPEGLDEAMGDLRLHQAALFAALQPSLAKLLGDLAPEGIENEAETGRLGGNRRAKAWDIFVERWDAKTAPHENGMLDEFLNHFSASYREMVEKSRSDPSTGTKNSGRNAGGKA